MFKSKIQNLIFLILILIFGFWILDFHCYAQPISSSNELIENALAYDGKTVIYQGEVIGEVMCRGSFCWANLNDGYNAIGVWMPQDFIRVINYVGNYKNRGDRIEVIGIFNRACRQHIGDLDIHALSIQKIASGMPMRETVDMQKINLVVGLLGLLCLVLISKKLKRS